MTDFHWIDATSELAIIDPKHPTYLPLCGNRCWALVPTSLDGYAYLVNLQIWMRILKRFGLYLDAGGRRGSLPEALDDLETFYGANVLRLTGRTNGLAVEIKVYPDAEAPLLYLTLEAANATGQERSLAAVLAADFEFHPAPWAAKGFTEDATNDYSDAGRKLNPPHDDRLDVSDDGAVVCVSDSRNPGLGFLAGPTPAGWTLDRTKFSFETPIGGHRPLRAADMDKSFELTGETHSDDSFCALRHELRIPAGSKARLTFAFGHQEQRDLPAIRQTLADADGALERTSRFYGESLANGVKLTTPDPVINAQFNLNNVFIKLNEHHCGAKRSFVPAPHYHNWLCGDMFFTAMGYAYANDIAAFREGMDMFRRFQHADGFIPDLPLWTEGPSWRERPGLAIGGCFCYITAYCHLLKLTQDKSLAAELFPSFQQALSVYRDLVREGLVVPDGDFVFDSLDWPCGFGHCPQTFMSLLVYKALLDLAELAEWLGKADCAAELRAEGEQLKHAINEKAWIEEQGHYRIGLATEPVGKGEDDRQRFTQKTISWSTLMAVVWGVAEGARGETALKTVRQRLLTPYGMKFADPPWEPVYTDAKGAATYEAGRVQNGGYWQAWWSIPTFAGAQILLGQTEQAFADFLEVRLDRLYERFTLSEKGRTCRFLTIGEWIDTDLTFPITSVPYAVTCGLHNQTLIESFVGVQVGYDSLTIDPHLPAAWDRVDLKNLRVGDSTWNIEIRGRGRLARVTVDGSQRPSNRIPITPGEHAVRVDLEP